MADEIEYVTHASLLLRHGGRTLLTDPFFYPELDPFAAPSVRSFPPRALPPESFGRLDLVFSSHEHHDHCHPETLEVLRPRIGTVLLPADRPPLAERYRELGFRDLVFLENRRPLDLGGGLEVTCYWDDPIDSMLLVRAGGTSFLHANDCRPDPATLRDIARRGRVDYGFLCSTSVQELFPLILPRPTDELERLAQAREEAFFEDSVARIEALAPRVVIPYSYTATYVELPQLHLNTRGRLTPSTFRRRLAERLPAQACWVLQPGDVIEPAADRIRPVRAENLWGETLDEFKKNLVVWACAIQPELPRFDPGDLDDGDAALRAHLEARLRDGVPHAGLYASLGDAVAIDVVGRSGRRRHLVDLRRRAEPPEPGLIIEIPASLVATMLSGTYDPFMILYTYKVRFRPHPRLALEPAQEYLLYLGVMLTLFMDRANPLLDDFASLS